MSTTTRITQLRTELMKGREAKRATEKDVWIEHALGSLRDLETYLETLPGTNEHHVIVTRGQWKSLTQLLGMIQPREQS